MKSFKEYIEEKNKMLLEEEKKTKDFKPDEAVWKKWRTLSNLSADDLADFKKSGELTDSEKVRIDVTNTIIEMLKGGKTFSEAKKNWKPSMWAIARKQSSFISKIKGMRKNLKGNPFEKENGSMTGWLKSLFLWGHDPRKPLRKV